MGIGYKIAGCGNLKVIVKVEEGDSSPDPCGTRRDRVGCYVPVLTRCPAKPLHRSKEEHSGRRDGLNAHLFEKVAEGKGFEPSVACATHAFQACSFDHSDTPLYMMLKVV